jgi:hypothetical protein
MADNNLEKIIKDTKKLLKDDKFIAFSGVDRTTLDKKAFTNALKVSADTLKMKVAVEYPGSCVENLYIYSKHSHACLTIPPMGEFMRKTRHVSVHIRMTDGLSVFRNLGTDYTMPVGYFKIDGQTQFDFELAFLKIRSVLERADNLVNANNALQSTIRTVTELDTESPFTKARD